MDGGNEGMKGVLSNRYKSKSKSTLKPGESYKDAATPLFGAEKNRHKAGLGDMMSH